MTTTMDGWMTYAGERGQGITQDASSEAALVRAQDYIRYRFLDRGYRPPEDVVDAATYEAARLELETPGFFHKTFTPDQQKVLTQVGNIRWETRGTASGPDGATPVSTMIEAMMRPYLAPRLPRAYVV